MYGELALDVMKCTNLVHFLDRQHYKVAFKQIVHVTLLVKASGLINIWPPNNSDSYPGHFLSVS